MKNKITNKEINVRNQMKMKYYVAEKILFSHRFGDFKTVAKRMQYVKGVGPW